MIIKSMSRKSPSFGQLIAYMASIHKSDERYCVYQNIYSRNIGDIEDEFQNNSAFVAKRKNGVYLYHEILSITKAKELDDDVQKQMLRELALQYAQRRAPHNLVFGALHDDHDDHLHYHLLISSNAVGESKKTRMSKAQFDRFKKGMEKEALEKYPELKQEVVINKKASAKLSNKGAELKRRTKKTPQRDQVIDRLNHVFEAHTKQGLADRLVAERLEIYVRGKSTGVIDLENGRKHRLKTLGLIDQYGAISKSFEAEKPKQENTNMKETYSPDYKNHQETNDGDKRSAKEENISHKMREKETITDKLHDAVKNAGEDVNTALNGKKSNTNKISKERELELKKLREKKTSNSKSKSRKRWFSFRSLILEVKSQVLGLLGSKSVKQYFNKLRK